MPHGATKVHMHKDTKRLIVGAYHVTACGTRLYSADVANNMVTGNPYLVTCKSCKRTEYYDHVSSFGYRKFVELCEGYLNDNRKR